MPRLAVAGVVNVRAARCFDTFPTEPGNGFDTDGINIRLSGAGWTVARTLQQLGTDVTFATYVGADELGQLVLGQLLRHRLLGPGTLFCESQPTAMVLHGPGDTKISATDLRATPQLCYPAELFAAQLDRGGYDMAVLANIGFTRSLIPATVDRGLPIATDLHLVDDVASAHNRPWMQVAHVLACSHEKLPCGPEEWVHTMWSRYGTEIVLVGCGAAGAVLGVRELGRIWHVPATLPRGLRYTSGAGDTLFAAFVHHYLALADPLLALRCAALTAGWKVGGPPEEEANVPTTLLRRLHSEAVPSG